MKILVFNGSPAKNGNTAALIAEFCRHVAGEVKVIDCYRVNVRGCVDCKYCFSHEGCSIKDDMQAIYQDVGQADVVVVASPMHFGITSAPLFTVISRLQSYWAQRNIRKLNITDENKLGVLLVSCGGEWVNMERLMDGLMEIAFDHMGVSEVMGRVYAKCTDTHPAAQNEKALKQTRRLAGLVNENTKG